MTGNAALSAGRPWPMGASLTEEGANFAVFSQHATRVTLCLFSEDGTREVQRIDLPEHEGTIWHGHVAGIAPGQLYGLRVDGPYRPEDGHRFNWNKLLLDPYARRITGHPIWHDALMGYSVDHVRGDLSFDRRDSAPYMPKCVVEAPLQGTFAAKRPGTKRSDSVIYEAHVKGLTQRHPDVQNRGTFLGLAEPPILDHLNRLGVTAIELLPVHTFLNDRFLVDQGLINFWGYQSIGFFAPDPRYLSRGDIAEFRQMVDKFHGAGIEVILDVVYNHSGEGNQLGPTLSFRGLDNCAYYRLDDDRRYYINDTGTGNTLDLTHPMVLRLVMDSLRYWVETMGVDGFRFDLCSTLGRTRTGFSRDAAFFKALRQDPVLAGIKLIAEPWDIGPGGYQLGAYPPPFSEWNDQFRDGIRRFWRGDPGRIGDLAARITGSATQFDHSWRIAAASVNFLTSHDGFTLRDVVSYDHKHNAPNGENNRDGHNANFSDNMGVEGPTKDDTILAARARRRRNMMATLLLSQGIPMILSGDEIGNTQYGNNNAYCQDNDITWLNWAEIDHDFLAFTRKLVAFRRNHPILRQKLFLHAHERALDGRADLFWWRADGKPMSEADWSDPDLTHLCVEMRMADGTPDYADAETAIFAVFNVGEPVTVTMPAPTEGLRWYRDIDTSAPEAPRHVVVGNAALIPGGSVVAFVLETNG
ncbi:MAG: glycogen debranching protein GlgX [Pseudomonadota bacterium]